MRLPALNWATRLKAMKNTMRPVASRPKAAESKRSRKTSGTVMAPDLRATWFRRLPMRPIMQMGTTM